MTDETNLTANATSSASTRRQMIRGTAMGLSSLTMAITPAGARQAATTSAKAKTIVMTRAIHQEEDFKCAPSGFTRRSWTPNSSVRFQGGRAAEIHREAGGALSLFAGHVVGRNLELIPNRRIIQAWRAVSWPESIYSIARFELLEQGSGTRVVFDHTGFPPELAQHLESGWNENYWTALQKYLG